MSNGLVSIVIVTAKASDSLEKLTRSINAQTFQPLETIIIDNSRGANLFYCQALNKGIKQSRGEFVLCLNDDVVLRDDFIEKALKGFSVGPRVGMVSSRVLRSDGEIIDSAGLSLSVWFTAKDRGYGKSGKDRFTREGYIFGVNGAVAFYRCSMLEDIRLGEEYFDEEHRIFYEDLDIAWRAQNAGWKCYYIPDAVAYHARGLTVRGGKGLGMPFARRYLSDELHFCLLKNRYLAIIKNAGLPEAFFHLPFILFYDLASLAYVIFFKPGVLKSIFSGLPGIKSALLKRKMIKNTRSIRFLVGKHKV